MLKILRFDKKIVKPLSDIKAFSGIFQTVSTSDLPLSANNFQQAILSLISKLQTVREGDLLPPRGRALFTANNSPFPAFSR